MTSKLRSFRQDPSNTRTRRIAATAFAALLVVAAAAAGIHAGMQPAAPPQSQLTAMLPQGALLTIEAKDFSALLRRWNTSSEEQAWLKSENYSVFSRSRLFGRLSDAQKEFAQAAGLPPDAAFLNEVAGGESVFAWYDIGKLEFLYITRMPQGSADRTRLVQMRGKFATRQIGSQAFYVRTSADLSQPDDTPAGDARTVAFAVSGDWLLLATREDLMAGALTLLAAHSGNSAIANAPEQTSVSQEAWFVDARAAAPKDPGDLRMTLNLDKIVPTPYFRSYWVQQNITEMKRYRSAVADLYTGEGDFREERVLLPESTLESSGFAPNLAVLTALLPQDAGVFRAVAAPGVDSAVASLDEKLIDPTTGSFQDTRIAPDADLTVNEVGSASDLETRIDAAPLAHPVKGAELAPLRQALAVSSLDGMMTVSRTGSAADGIWIPFQSAVVLSAQRDWDVPAMQSALRQALAARLTAGGLGLAWKPVKIKDGSYFEISDTRPLEMAARGKLCILADDPGLMREMLSRASGGKRDRERSRKSGTGAQLETAMPKTSDATLIAGFDLTQERANFARWSALVDRTHSGTAGEGSDSGNEPNFFSQNMRSLGDAFAPLESERIVERRDGSLTRQTVTYAWQH